jgi:hypothetical protein
VAVLIVSNEQDLGADFVVLELKKRAIRTVRCNAERLPEWRVSLRPGVEWSLTDPLNRTILSSDATGVWWRRPERPQFEASLPADQQNALVEQWQAFIEGLSSVPGPRWVSAPAAIVAAEDKALQIAVAVRVGLRVPQTLWTNDVALAHRQIDGSAAIVKTVTSAHWENDAEAAFVFASPVASSDLPADAESFAAAPAVIQAMIAPKRDVRVTVVGKTALAAETTTADLDWRTDPSAEWRQHKLPAEVASRCIALVEHLGLQFGGIDLALDDSGAYWFLEINPNGEWGWLQACGLPIASALTDVLTSDAR